MIIFWIVVVSVILMVLFVAVTIAGGKTHDRHNEAEARKLAQASKDVPPIADAVRPLKSACECEKPHTTFFPKKGANDMTRTVTAQVRLVPPKPYQRQVVLTFAGPDSPADIILSASEAAILTFEIVRALEDADHLSKGHSADTTLSLKFPAHKTDI